MANDLVKGLIKVGSAIITGAFTVKVAKEGQKNVDAWKASRNQSQQKK